MSNEAKCPFSSGQNPQARAGGRGNRNWWPDQIDLQVLAKHSSGVFVRLAEIGLLESEGNYTRLYFGKERPLVARSLAQLEEKLDPEIFFRASRKHVINLRWIESVDTAVSGALVARLKGGFEIEMSRRQSQRFKESMTL